MSPQAYVGAAVTFGLLWTANPVLCAATATSASYAITTDSIDSGGGPTTSSNYSNTGCIGSAAGVATVASPAETLKAGYIGQLYQVIGLSLAPNFVADGTTQQLQATQTLDDSTTLVLQGSGQTWSIVAGQLPSGLSLNPSTGVISGVPTVSGNFSFTVQVTDGLGNSAEQTFSGQITTQTFSEWEAQFPQLQDTAAGDSPEDDGVPNLLKYVYNIDPSQPMSAADLTKLPGLGVTGDTETLTFHEYTLITPNVVVQVEFSTDLQNWSQVPSNNIVQIGTDGDDAVMQAQVAYAPGLFLRLHVIAP